jgi:predicted nucleic acid-binding protein
MRYILDASVALKWVLPEPDSAKALKLRADFRAAVHELSAPDTFPVEVAHALARAERRKVIPTSQADALLAVVLSTPPVLHPYLPFLKRALSIASQARIGVYDCLYLALAEHEKCQFVTADDRLVRNLQQRFPFIVALASMP